MYENNNNALLFDAKCLQIYLSLTGYYICRLIMNINSVKQCS